MAADSEVLPAESDGFAGGVDVSDPADSVFFGVRLRTGVLGAAVLDDVSAVESLTSLLRLRVAVVRFLGAAFSASEPALACSEVSAASVLAPVPALLEDAAFAGASSVVFLFVRPEVVRFLGAGFFSSVGLASAFPLTEF